MNKIIFFTFILNLLFLRFLNAVQYDYYDIFGSHFMYGEKLFYIEDNASRIGGHPSGSSVIGLYDKAWIDEFRSHIVLYETYDNVKNMIELGRTPTKFTSLTLKKTLFGPSYLYRQQQGFKFDSQIPWYLDRFTLLFTRTDFQYETTINWKWEENVGEDMNGPDMDEYFIATRLGFDLAPDLKMGLSYVNQHNTLQGINQKAYLDPFAGSERNSMYKGISVRFSDATPDDDQAGSAVYSIRVLINGVERPELAFRNNITGSKCSIYWSNPVNDHQEANGTRYIDFWFDLSGYTGVNDVRFYFDVANDYYISYRTDKNMNGYVSDDPYIRIATAAGNVKDYKNRRVVEWHYGELTGRSLYAVDVQGTVFGINFSAEYSRLANYKRMPGDPGITYPVENADAYYIRLLKEFRYLDAGLELFNIDWNYDAGFAVEDNDDNDDYPDITDDLDIFDGGDGINFKTLDKNNNGISDYEEDFLLFDNDSYEFREGEDDNNNNIFDNEENDDKPDYPYEQGTKGGSAYLAFNYFRPFLFVLKGIYSVKEIDDQMNNKEYLDVIYKNKIFEPSEIYVRNRTAYIKDTIPNDTIDQQGNVVKDPLDYKDNLNNTLLIRMTSEFIKKLILINSFYNKYDISQFSRECSFEQKPAGISYATLHKIKYTYTPFKRFDIIPLFKISWLYQYSIQDRVHKELSQDRMKAGGLECVYQWTPRTRVMIGYQRLLTDEILDIDERALRDSFAVEFIHTASYWGRAFGLMAGFTYAVQDYQGETTKEDYMQEKLYVHTYFRW
ncbi:MAG: hypothetical protein PHF84_06160 [bacterium]|nr:hypothetical protein [bacterium]